MTKKELSKIISAKTGVEKKQTVVIINNLMETIKNALVEEESVYLRGFGTFAIQTRNQKRFYPEPGRLIIIPEHKIPAFKPSERFIRLLGKKIL